MPTSTNGIARATAIAMVNAGSTYNLAADIAAGRTFSAGDSNGDQYYLAAGKDPTRTARVSAQNFRRQNLSTDDYTTHVLPLTKIGKYRQDNTVEIIAVI